MQRQTVINFFNKVFYDFSNEIKSIDSDLYQKYFSGTIKVIDLDIPKHINNFSSSLDITKINSLKDCDSLFDNECVKKLKIAKNALFVDILSNLKDSKILELYLYNFILFSYLHLLYKHIDNNDVDSGDDNNEDEGEINSLVDNVIIELRKIQNNEETGEDKVITDENIIVLLAKMKKDSIEKIDLDNNIEDEIKDKLENSTIGNIAKEISSEIDLSEMDIRKPEDITKLMSGNIIGKVGEKIQKKIASGEINQQDLLNEAMSMLGSMGNNMFMNKDMMKNFSKLASGMNTNKINKKTKLGKKL